MRFTLDSRPSIFIWLVGLLGFFACYGDIFFPYRECNIVNNKGYTVDSRSGLNIIQLTFAIRSELSVTLLLNPYSSTNSLLALFFLWQTGAEERQ